MIEWFDEGIILDNRKYAESKSFITLLSKKNGLANGLSKNCKKNQAIYQIGNIVQVTWRARLEEQLGTFSSELLYNNMSHLFHNKEALFALQSAVFLLKHSLSQNTTETKIYEALYYFITQLGNRTDLHKNYLTLEEKILQYTGYALDYTRCAVTGVTEDLYYLSPKTGKAVCKKVGEPYRDKLFLLPNFFIDSSVSYSKTEINKGFKITGYFIEKYLLKPKNFALPKVRSLLISSDQLRY